MVVTVNFDESYNGVADKTLDEIIAAFDAGTFVSIKMLMVGNFWVQAPLMITTEVEESGDQHIQAFLNVYHFIILKLLMRGALTWRNGQSHLFRQLFLSDRFRATHFE